MARPGILALVATALAARPAMATVATVGEPQILDGCEAGGSGADIHSLQSHYEPGRDRIVVTLRLCGPVRRNATYRVHLDHAAPFVGRAASRGGCATTEDSAVALTPAGHRGVGTSEVRGNEIRFVVPLDDLHVASPNTVPLIPLWATSRLGASSIACPIAKAATAAAIRRRPPRRWCRRASRSRA